MRTEGFESYSIKNEGKLCNARGGSATDGSFLKMMIPDTDTNGPAGGYSPTGDPTFSWLQSAGQYCQAGRCVLRMEAASAQSHAARMC